MTDADSSDSDWSPPELYSDGEQHLRTPGPASREPVPRRGLWFPGFSIGCPRRNCQTGPGWGAVVESQAQTRGLSCRLSVPLQGRWSTETGPLPGGETQLPSAPQSDQAILLEIFEDLMAGQRHNMYCMTVNS